MELSPVAGRGRGAELLAGGPLPAYGIQRLIRHRGKDRVVNVGRRANPPTPQWRA